MKWPRILTSSKYQAALAATAVLTVKLVFTLTDDSIPRPEKQAESQRYIYAVAGAWVAAIGATGWEDYGAKRDAPASAQPPAVQVNTGQQAANVQQQSPPARSSSSPVIRPSDPVVRPSLRSRS